jgi:cytochrome P450
MVRWWFWSLFRQSVVFQATEHAQYTEKRKALGSAFFKSKLEGMTQIIKQVTLMEIKSLQKQQGLDRKQLGELTMDLQSRIIISISVGTAYADTEILYENAKGFEKLSLQSYLDRLNKEIVFKGLKPVNLMFPLLNWATMVQNIINERRAGKTQAYD